MLLDWVCYSKYHDSIFNITPATNEEGERVESGGTMEPLGCREMYRRTRHERNATIKVLGSDGDTAARSNLTRGGFGEAAIARCKLHKIRAAYLKIEAISLLVAQSAGQRMKALDPTPANI